MVCLEPPLLYASEGGDDLSHARTEAGIPFVQNFTPAEYSAHRENWAIAQDDRGIMYFANSRGVLEYDGVSWRLILMPNASIVRSLALGENNIIYVGASGDFGYLAPEPGGSMQFFSLLHLIPDTHRDFGDVWQTLVTPEGIYFRTRKYLFRLQDDDITVWEAESSFYSPFYFGDTFYIVQSRLALMAVEGDSLVAAPFGDEFKSIYPYAMLPYDSHRFLLGSSSGEFFLYSRNALTPFPTAADDMLQSHSVYHGVVLPDSTYALAVTGLGIIVIDRDGNLLHVMDKSTGLPDEAIKFLFVDQLGVLWCTHTTGISRIEYSSGFTYFDERNGLRGSVRDILRFNDTLYAATSQGLFYLTSPAGLNGTTDRRSMPFIPPHFTRISDIAVECWSLHSDGESLLIASDHGVWILDGSGVNLLSMDQSQTLTLLRSRTDPQRIYAGLIDGAAEIRRTGTEWRYAGRIPGIHEEVRRIAEEEDGAVWLGTRYQGVVRLTPDTLSAPGGYHVERFDTTDGLPAIRLNHPFDSPRGIRFSTRDGVRYFDEDARRFLPDSLFAQLFPHRNRSGFYPMWNGGDTMWIRSDQEAGGLSLVGFGADSLTLLDNTPFLRIASLYSRNIVYQEGDIIWFGGADGIFRYDTELFRTPVENYSTLIRHIVVERDSVIFSGFTSGLPERMIFPFEHNYIRISYSAPGFYGKGEPSFTYRLMGLDPGWAPWTQETQREYTYLPEGVYQFQVKAINLYHQESAVAVFDFMILPPWYRTLWAYSLYFVFLVTAVIGLFRVKTRQIWQKERQRALEQINRMEEIHTARQTERDHLRKKTSEDFHDELGHLITKISLFSELARRKALEDAGLLEYIRKIEQHTKSLSTGIKDFIWILNPERDSLYESLKRIKEFGEALYEHTDIEFRTNGIRESYNDIKLNPEVRRHILMIFKEAMTNTIKHSACSKVTLNVSFAGAALTIALSDNGNGFDPRRQTSGSGIRNMSERAKRLKGNCLATSKPGGGTTIQFSASIDVLTER
jgi:signal transduction histidine kinase